MTTKFIDRRNPAAPETDPAVEAERMERRRAVCRMAARRDLELEPALLAEADVKASEARCDQLADEHAKTCGVWQTELAELEQRAIERIGRREPPDTDEDARRAELAKLIATATADLEKAIAAEREIQAIARRTARKIREGRPPSSTILMALTRPPLVNSRLLGQEFVFREKIKWLKARQNAAEKTLKICRYNVSEIAAGRMSGVLSVWTGKSAAWECELQAVGSEIASTLAEAENLHRRMIDE